MRLLSTTRARLLIAVALCFALSSAGWAAKARILVPASLAADLADVAKANDVELVPAKTPTRWRRRSSIATRWSGSDLGRSWPRSSRRQEPEVDPDLERRRRGVRRDPRAGRRAPSCSPTRRSCSAPGVADHAMALLLNLTRDMKWWNEQMKVGFVQKPRLPMIELQGKTALVIGYGGIGHQVAQRAAGFGMRVLAIDVVDIASHPRRRVRRPARGSRSTVARGRRALRHRALDQGDQRA